MQLFHIYHQNKFQKLVHSEFWLFEFSVWLHTFSRSMIAIFVPIFLLQTGYLVGEIMIYYFCYYTIDIPLNFLARWLIKKIGAKKVIIIASLFSIAFFIGLYNLTINNWILLIGIAIFAAIYDALYWVAHLFLFMKCSKDNNNVAGDVSILSAVRSIAGILAPALGAFLIIFFSKKILIIVSVAILTSSIIPLLKMKKIPDKPKQKQVSFMNFFTSWKLMQDYLSKGFFQIHNNAESIIWPLFLFIFFSNVESIAVLPIIVSITTILFTFFTGNINKKNRKNMIVIGSLAIALIWISRLVIKNSAFYYISVFLVSLFSLLISIPIDSNIFEKGEKRDTLTTSMYRNMFSMSFGACFYGVLSVLINVFNISFVLASFCLLFIIWISYLSGIKKR